MKRRALFLSLRLLLACVLVPAALAQSDWHKSDQRLQTIKKQTRGLRHKIDKESRARREKHLKKQLAELAKSGPLGRHLACFESIKDFTGLEPLRNNPRGARKSYEFTVLPSTQKNKKGIYLCSATAVSFNAATAEPLTLRKKDVEDYYFALHKEGKDPLHIRYSFPLAKGTPVEARYSRKESGVLRTTLLPPGSADAEAREGVEKELARRIGLAYQTYMNEYRYMTNVIVVLRKKYDTGGGDEHYLPDPDRYAASLKPCQGIESEAIRQAIQDQKNRFFPHKQASRD